MRFYAASPTRRIRQVISDVVAVVLIVLFIVAGVLVDTAIRALGQVGQGVADTGTRLHSSLGDAASTLGGVPLIGGTASSPLKRAADAATNLTAAGQQQHAVATQLGILVGLVVAVLPILVILAVWLPARLRFAQTAKVAGQLSESVGGRDLLALRALTTADPAVLFRIADQPSLDWRQGDETATRLLAETALRDAGLKR